MKKLLLGCVAVSLLAVSARADEIFEADNGAQYMVDTKIIIPMGDDRVAVPIGMAENGVLAINTKEVYLFDCHGHMQIGSGPFTYIPPRSVGAAIANRVCNIAHPKAKPAVSPPATARLESFDLHNQCARGEKECVTNFTNEIIALRDHPALDGNDISDMRPGEEMKLKCPEISLDGEYVMTQLMRYLRYTEKDIPKRIHPVTARADLAITLGCKLAEKRKP